MDKKPLYIILAVSFFGFIIGAAILARSLERFKKEDRYISVKGFAEREVKADLVIWTMKMGIGTNNLQEGSAEMAANKAKVIQFLIKNGIKASEITEKDIMVQDKQANAYEAARITLRYFIQETIEVRSAHVDNVQKVSRKTGDLLNAGVVLTKEEWNGSGLKFIFTKLKQIKPDMLTEAIKNAKDAAIQFTRESGTHLGALRKASQGLFSVQDRDEFLSSQSESGNAYPQGRSDLYKTVRVVISVDYSVD